MRQVLNSEKLKEVCNAAALGMFNAGVGAGMESNEESEISKVSKFIADLEKENLQRIKTIKEDTDFLTDGMGKYLFTDEKKLFVRSLESEKEMLKINQDRVKNLKKKFKL